MFQLCEINFSAAKSRASKPRYHFALTKKVCKDRSPGKLVIQLRKTCCKIHDNIKTFMYTCLFTFVFFFNRVINTNASLERNQPLRVLDICEASRQRHQAVIVITINWTISPYVSNGFVRDYTVLLLLLVFAMQCKYTECHINRLFQLVNVLLLLLIVSIPVLFQDIEQYVATLTALFVVAQRSSLV